jgi:hypothetical protein
VSQPYQLVTGRDIEVYKEHINNDLHELAEARSPGAFLKPSCACLSSSTSADRPQRQLVCTLYFQKWMYPDCGNEVQKFGCGLQHSDICPTRCVVFISRRTITTITTITTMAFPMN